jgi:hypothetical protein
MKHSKFSNEQIVAILKEQEAEMPTAEACRRHGVSPSTFTNGKPSMAAWWFLRLPATVWRAR